jgi:hypothetical protein
MNYFGQGLVSTPTDFGLSGETPTHPELLDWLASQLRDNGWSLKKLHRMIVTSATYRQHSLKVSANHSRALAHQTLRRLTAEQLRDSMLATAGRMNQRHLGKPSWPTLPVDVLQANPAFLDDNAEKTKGWYPSDPRDLTVRSIYLVQKRTIRIPFMELFDLPENTVPCGRRNCSLVAPQALTLLNNSETQTLAIAFADRVRQTVGNDPARQVTEAFQRSLQRDPTEAEFHLCIEFLKKRRLDELCRALFNTNEFVFLD